MESGFLTTYRSTLEHLDSVAEESGPYQEQGRTPERLVSAIWFDQQLDSEQLKTVDGRRVSVISPGRWNEGPGPDFQDAEIRISGGRILQGDVEVEVFATNWDSHAHADNPDFGNVVLKVCLWNDIRRPRKSGIPLVELFPYLADASLLGTKSTRGYPLSSPTMRGRCQPMLPKKDMDKALLFIAAAGEERLLKKAERMASLSRTFGIDQTLYKGLMEAAGYSRNKEPLSRLADALHLETLRTILSRRPVQDRRKTLLAVFYGCTGFFTRYPDSQDPAWRAELKNVWEELREEHSFVTIEGIQLGKMRPANSPYRRLAAIADLLAKVSGLKLFEYFLAALGNVENRHSTAIRQAADRLMVLLTQLHDPFWAERLSPKSEPGGKQYALVGEGLARTIIVNIIIPLVLSWSRNKQKREHELFIRALLEHLNGMPHNATTRFTSTRLFGPDSAEPRFARNALLNQGLIQIYGDFCKSLRNGCPDCEFVEFLEDL